MWWKKMYINIEGKGIVTSNNCWCQGDVSDAFKDLMPDNATWATKEEFDKAPVVGYVIEGVGLVLQIGQVMKLMLKNLFHIPLRIVKKN